MLERISVGRTYYKYQVKTWVKRLPERTHIHVGRLYHTLTLAPVNSVTRVDIARTARLYLDKTQVIVLACKKIDLYPAYAYVHAVDAIAM